MKNFIAMLILFFIIGSSAHAQELACRVKSNGEFELDLFYATVPDIFEDDNFISGITENDLIKIDPRFEQDIPQIKTDFGIDCALYPNEMAMLSPGRYFNRLDACRTARECQGQPIPDPDPICGNGKREAGERCDNGSANGDHLCSNSCRIPTGCAAEISGSPEKSQCISGALQGAYSILFSD